MTELTKAQLIEEAKLKIAIAKCHPNSGMARVEGELFKIALASLEAEPVSQTYKLTFEQWLEKQHDKIDVDCGCVSTETLMHWMRTAYEAGNYPVTPDGWISCSERMPDTKTAVLVAREFDRKGDW